MHSENTLQIILRSELETVEHHSALGLVSSLNISSILTYGGLLFFSLCILRLQRSVVVFVCLTADRTRAQARTVIVSFFFLVRLHFVFFNWDKNTYHEINPFNKFLTVYYTVLHSKSLKLILLV